LKVSGLIVASRYNYLLNTAFILAFIAPLIASAENVVSRFELLSGIKQRDHVGTAITKKPVGSDTYIYGKSPEQFLVNNYHYLPSGSRVLDMSMGEGQHAVFLAQKGYRVVGVDSSALAIKKTKFLAKEFGVRIDTVHTDINNYQPKINSFDAIISIFHVERSLIPKITRWLKPGGVLIYHAFTDRELSKPQDESHSENKDQTLQPKELLRLFPKMTILKYEEPIHLNNYTASIILKNE
jgi:tellurite methyltransferase